MGLFMNEHELIQRILTGESALFEELLRQHEKKVYSLALRYTRNSADAMDLSQEIFIKIYTHLSDFRKEGKFSTWLYRIATNTCLDFLRKERRVTLVPLFEEDQNGREVAIDIEDTSPLPEDLVLREEQMAAVAASIDGLQKDYKQILILRDVQNFSYNEIAEILQLEGGTVKSRIFRAREALRKQLLKNYGNLFDSFSSEELIGKKGGDAV